MMGPPESGTEIDGFVLGERIHVGTMAWIYRLMGPDGPLPLIMKIPRLGAGEPAVNVVSFEVCRQVLGALEQGPQNPTLVAYGDVETTPYLVMEFIEGERLIDWTTKAPLSAAEVARIGSAFAVALHRIHRQDVLHLDLKSGNVLFRKNGEAALIDFGLSAHRHYPDLLAEEFRYPVGNWEYMSPEQILGIRCDPRSDIFALGAHLYELATGQLPFGRPRTVRQLRQRLYSPAIPPTAHVATIPLWLQEIILHCLEIDNRKRYTSAADVAFDLTNPEQVALTERASQRKRRGLSSMLVRRISVNQFEPAPCPPLSFRSDPASIVMVAIDAEDSDPRMHEALREAVRRLVAADTRCRLACMTVVPPAAALEGEGEQATATGRHIRRLIMLRQWTKSLQLPEERVTHHVLESAKPATALLDYASVNDVEQIVIGAPRRAARALRSGGISKQIVADATCSVTVVRPRQPS